MGIRVKDGHVWMTAEFPVFVGTTGEGSFPAIGTPMMDFHFIPRKGTSGTLVFDKANMESRSPATAQFCQYWHESEKLKVKIGLRAGSLREEHQGSPEAGFYFLVVAPYTVYYTGNYHRNPQGYVLCKVPIIDMLKYLESKISLEQLTECKIEN